MSNKPLFIIAAMTKQRGIGFMGTIPWHYPQDFRKITLHSNVIMGRKTWESLPAPLSKRANIVITSQIPNSSAKDTIFANSPEMALRVADETKYLQSWVIGGQRVYETFIHYPQLTRINLTIIPDIIHCDTFFPQIPPNFNVTQITDLTHQKEYPIFNYVLEKEKYRYME
jgi:dihydrofolate reductase